MVATAEQAFQIATAAREDSRRARNHALEANEGVGKVARSLADIARAIDNLGGKQDACITDIRTLAKEVRKLHAVEHAMRKKLESFSDLDALANLSDREVARMKLIASAKRLGRRMATAAAIAAASAGGVTLLWILLHHFGVHMPAEMLP